MWSEAIAVALPSAHPLAATDELRLRQLADLPVRLPAREANPPLVDLIVAACRAAGFEPRLAPAMTDEDMLAAIGAGSPTWTVYYAAQAELVAAMARGVTFRPLSEPPLAMPTALAIPGADRHPALDALLGAGRVLA